MGVAGVKLDDDTIEQIYDLYAAHGLGKRAIARKLSITLRTVKRYIERAEKRGLEQISVRMEEMKIRMTHQYLYIYREAVAGWERSQQDAITRKQSEKNSTMGDGGDEFKQDIEVKGRDGDPRFQQTAMSAIEGLRSLWGLDAPVSMDLGFRVPTTANPNLARARNEAARVIMGELLSPAELSIRQIGSGSTVAAQVQSQQSHANALAQELADEADRPNP